MALKTCTRPAGSVAAYAKVEIRLSQDTVITASGLNYLASVIPVTAGADGSISVQLQATNDLTPNNTYYTVSEYAGSTDSTYYVQVPQTAGPFVLTAIQVSVPPAPAPAGAAHVASLLVDGAATVVGALEAGSSTSIDMLGSNQTISGVKLFGGGDDLQLVGSLAFPSRNVDIRAGTVASPDRTLNSPPLKLSRVLKILDADGFGSNSDPSSSTLVVQTSVDAASDRQGIGVYSVVNTASTTTPASGKSADAFPLFGVGTAVGSSTHLGAGAYLEGKRTTDTATTNGAEIRTTNQTGTDSGYSLTGHSACTSLWLTSGGTASNGAALAVYATTVPTNQFEAGIILTAGSVRTVGFQDNSSSATSVIVSGSHATAAIAVAAGANMVLVGGVSSIYSNANALLELQGSNNFVDGLLAMGSVANLKTYTTRIRNSAGQMSIGIIGVANDLITGSIAGDGVFRTSSANKFVHMGGTVSVVKVGNDNTLGFYNHAGAAQQTISGSRGGNAALADLLTKLALSGLIVDSTSA